MSRESVAADRQSKMFVFLLSVILIVSLVGFGLRHLLPSADDAAMASMETLKTAFAERAQLVHVYWINNGKRSVQYLDVQDWGDEDSIRIAYQVNAAGWVVDASFVGKRKNLGVNPCERLWESVLQKNSFEVMGNVHAKLPTGMTVAYIMWRTTDI